MNDYFSRELKQLREEEVKLQTAIQKNVSQIDFVKKELSINEAYPSGLSGTYLNLTIPIKFKDGNSGLIFGYLDEYYENVYSAGFYSDSQKFRESALFTNYIDEVWNIGILAQGNKADVDSYKSGQTVYYRNKLTVVSSCDFEFGEIIRNN